MDILESTEELFIYEHTLAFRQGERGWGHPTKVGMNRPPCPAPGPSFHHYLPTFAPEHLLTPHSPPSATPTDAHTHTLFESSEIRFKCAQTFVPGDGTGMEIGMDWILTCKKKSYQLVFSIGCSLKSLPNRLLCWGSYPKVEGSQTALAAPREAELKGYLR